MIIPLLKLAKMQLKQDAEGQNSRKSIGLLNIISRLKKVSGFVRRVGRALVTRRHTNFVFNFTHSIESVSPCPSWPVLSVLGRVFGQEGDPSTGSTSRRGDWNLKPDAYIGRCLSFFIYRE